MVLHLFLLGLLAVAWNMQFQKGMTVLNVTTQQIWTCYLASLCLCKATLPSSELSSGLQHCLELLDLLIQGVGVLGLVFHIFLEVRGGQRFVILKLLEKRQGTNTSQYQNEIPMWH